MSSSFCPTTAEPLASYQPHPAHLPHPLAILPAEALYMTVLCLKNNCNKRKSSPHWCRPLGPTTAEPLASLQPHLQHPLAPANRPATPQSPTVWAPHDSVRLWAHLESSVTKFEFKSSPCRCPGELIFHAEDGERPNLWLELCYQVQVQVITLSMSWWTYFSCRRRRAAKFLAGAMLPSACRWETNEKWRRKHVKKTTATQVFTWLMSSFWSNNCRASSKSPRRSSL